MQKMILVFNALLILAAFSCRPAEKNPALAVFQGGEVLEEDYIASYLSSTIYKPDELPSRDNLLELVNQLALEKLAVLEAKALKIDTTELFQVSWTETERKRLYQYYVQNEIIPQVVSDSLIRLFYDQITPQYRMAYIMRPFDETSPERFIASQKDSIEYVYRLLQESGDFHQLAKKYSQETSTKDKGGDLGFVIKESIGDAMIREMMDAIEPYTYSKPFRGFNGWYILYKGESREVVVPPFEETRLQIWETLFRTRRHEIKNRLNQTFETLVPVYGYRIKQDVLAQIARKAGSSSGDTKYTTLDFNRLGENELSMEVATYQGGSVKVYEMFSNPKTAPINMFEFNKDFEAHAQQHLFALEAKKTGLHLKPEISTELAKTSESALRGIFYQMAVRDKAREKFEMSKAEKSGPKKENDDDARKKYFDIEREIREAYETDLKKKYNFSYNEENFDQALSMAHERKLIQNKERELNK